MQKFLYQSQLHSYIATNNMKIYESILKIISSIKYLESSFTKGIQNSLEKIVKFYLKTLKEDLNEVVLYAQRFKD